jgi:hypothetical protein
LVAATDVPSGPVTVTVDVLPGSVTATVLVDVLLGSVTAMASADMLAWSPEPK